MSRLLSSNAVASTNTESRIQFVTEGGGHWAVWDRFIALDGKKAHHIGNVCNTCWFFFERLEGANAKVETDVGQQLNRGLGEQIGEIAALAARALPAGDYQALLLEVVPELTSPFARNDYFWHEHVTLWGVDGFWGMPHHPHNEYYRTPTKKAAEHAALFEFVVPMFPQSWLDDATSRAYIERLAGGDRPTALSVSILDVKGPAIFEGDDREVLEHWCLTHYLLDGHHKMFAAASQQRPITLLSFLAVNQGISTKEQQQQAISLLR